MNNILEVLLIVILIFTPIFLLVEALLFSSPKEWWLGIKNMFIKIPLFFKEKWRYRRMNTLEKINHVSTQINQASDLAEQKKLLVQLKSLAEKYREEQEKIVHPQEKWQVTEYLYHPRYRAVTLFIFFIVLLLIIFLLTLSPAKYETPFKQMVSVFKSLRETTGDRGFSNLLIAIFGGYFGYFIWYFRDLNNYRERETSLRDVMFKEHKQLVEWATTEAKAENKKDKLEPSDSTGIQTTEINPPMIQVAGIYQLAPFLKDHHANLYQRSTLEILRAIVNAGRPKWEQWIKDYENWIIGHKTGAEPEKPQLTAAERAVHAVLRENPVLFYHNNFNAKDFNLAGFDGRGLVLIGCDLEGAQLEGADWSQAKLQGANMHEARLQCAKLERSLMQKSSLDRANLNYAYVGFSSFQGASLMSMQLNHADASFVNFQQVNVVSLSIDNTNMNNSNFLYVVNLRHIKSINQSVNIDFSDVIVNEPQLILEQDKLGVKLAIQKCAISIADEQIKDHPLFKFVEGEHNIAIQELKEKGLTPTTQATLAAEHKETS